jgi:hypothetical protein
MTHDITACPNVTGKQAKASTPCVSSKRHQCTWRSYSSRGGRSSRQRLTDTPLSSPSTSAPSELDAAASKDAPPLPRERTHWCHPLLDIPAPSKFLSSLTTAAYLENVSSVDAAPPQDAPPLPARASPIFIMPACRAFFLLLVTSRASKGKEWHQRKNRSLGQ